MSVNWNKRSINSVYLPKSKFTIFCPQIAMMSGKSTSSIHIVSWLLHTKGNSTKVQETFSLKKLYKAGDMYVYNAPSCVCVCVK